MKLKSQVIQTISIFLIIPFFAISTIAQTDTMEMNRVNDKSSKPSEIIWTKRKTAEWYKNYEWLNGLHLTPDKSIDQQEFAQQYHSNKVLWDKAFTYMKETDLIGLKPGKYQIEGDDVYAIVTEGVTRNYDSTKWEAHRNYADIHYVIKGKEKIGIAAIYSARTTKDYDSSKDIGFYTTHGNFFIAEPSTFFIVFPKNAHFPDINIDTPSVVKKLVIKVRIVK